MTLKLFIFCTTYVLLVYGNNTEREDNVESYITKEAAKELRNKLSALGEQQEQDYDEILKRIIMSVQQPNDDNAEKQIVYEKKYFDYMPNDLDSEDVTDEDAAHELVKSYGDVMSTEHKVAGDNVRRVNSRKFKRDLTSQSRPRRQNLYYAPIPLVHYAIHPNVDFFVPQDFSHHPAASNIQSRFASYNQPNNNPWTPQNNQGKFHAPSNFYLPAAKPGHNNPSPPHNPQKIDDVQFVDRIPLFEEDDSRDRIWNTFTQKGGSNGNSIAPRPQPQEVTQRPQTTQQPYGYPNEVDSYVNPNQEAEVEIEYPPEIFENVPLTTRAPLKRPTISQSANRNPNQQKKQVVTTTTSKPIVKTTPQQNRESKNRQQNKTVPACVLAIVNCCSKYDEVVRTPCFEKYNCNGAFFGRSPCSPDIKAAAFREVEKFSRR